MATQQKYFNWIGKQNTGKRWASKLLKQLWTFTWEFWRLQQNQAGEPESKALAATHDELDERIAQQFDLHTTTNSTRLQRWFSQPLAALRSEEEDFKRQWLEAVISARQATD